MSHRGQLQCLNQPVAYHSHSLTPSSHSPVNKMAHPQRTASQDSTADGIRKRVCKACDRCRLKKSKCDGSNPCSRCKADNAICVFGERKKSHDKVYPKGYVEMLEQQQGQLVAGLQEMYKRLIGADAWKGAPLAEPNGNPLTHDILAALDLLESRPDGEVETFEEDPEKLQSRLLADGAGLTQHHHHRRGSFSSESEHSQHSHARSQSHCTPTLSKPTLFKENFTLHSEPPSPPATHSPAPRSQRHSFQQPAQPSPLQQSSPLSEELYSDWAYSQPPADNKFMMRTDYTMQTPTMEQNLGNMGVLPTFGQWEATAAPFDMMPQAFASFPNQLSSGYGNARYPSSSTTHMELVGFDPTQMDLDFNQFISPEQKIMV